MKIVEAQLEIFLIIIGFFFAFGYLWGNEDLSRYTIKYTKKGLEKIKAVRYTYYRFQGESEPKKKELRKGITIHESSTHYKIHDPEYDIYLWRHKSDVQIIKGL